MDENKKKKNFNSIVSAINFLSDQGYMLITSTTEVYNQQSTNYFFFSNYHAVADGRGDDSVSMEK
ncbi:hypothetical protein [Elizabethkingia anophelis]|uniref:hypothetical protein n=1 Tax=Elizabethkingia anophelis TaxID=1117645 RepID=UPI00259B8C18|nr:hypothetical protein [Elizabethkingia anophelis]WJK00034.1 hypothetical protein QTN78_18285 [Elizabethkingia anophelis]